jgi:esterase/lipase superfamily enzyme
MLPSNTMARFSLKSIFGLGIFVLICGFSAASSQEAPHLQSENATTVLYLTNREQVMLQGGALSFGADRSRSLSYGLASVVGRTTNDEIITSIDVLGHYPPTPYQVDNVAGGIRRNETVIRAHEKARNEIQAYLRERIKRTTTKQVVLFVHGYNNGFDDAIKSTDQICNDLGWDNFTCVAFTWPAGGNSGVLFGYNVDRESGEFSVADLQKTIRTISATPGLDKIYLVCHSRGADVVTMAMQALTREAYMSQSSFAEKFKVSEIILAAPDVDIDVAFTRIGSLRSEPDIPFGDKPNPRATFNRMRTHFTVYSSPHDRALSASKELFGSKHRLGLIDENIDEETNGLIKSTGDIADFITIDSSNGSLIGHDYYLSNPIVRNDLVNLIKYKKKAGSSDRDLIEINRPFWRLTYAQPATTDNQNSQ